VKNYFNTTGYERWRKIYGETEDVNKVQLDIRTGHAQTVDKVLRWVDEEGGVKGITVADCGCGTGGWWLVVAGGGDAAARPGPSGVFWGLVREQHAAAIMQPSRRQGDQEVHLPTWQQQRAVVYAAGVSSCCSQPAKCSSYVAHEAMTQGGIWWPTAVTASQDLVCLSHAPLACCTRPPSPCPAPYRLTTRPRQPGHPTGPAWCQCVSQ
jgi:hypothetical protein